MAGMRWRIGRDDVRREDVDGRSIVALLYVEY